MHHSEVGTQSPQRRGAHLVGCGLATVLHNAVSRAYVVQQEITERVDGLVAQCCRHDECASVDRCPCRNGGERAHMADGAADLVKQIGAGNGVRCGRSAVSRGGAWVPRMKRAKLSMSCSPSAS